MRFNALHMESYPGIKGLSPLTGLPTRGLLLPSNYVKALRRLLSYVLPFHFDQDSKELLGASGLSPYCVIEGLYNPSSGSAPS